MTIKLTPLGAGQDVGRSCILLTIGGKQIMLDCGMHMGYNDARRFPDFSYISRLGNFTEMLDAVIVTHFHLDHCGALPHFTEICGYDGPIYMTHPTKAICPILLEDYRLISTEGKGETNFFTANDIKKCMKKVVPINLHQTIEVDDELEIKAYYAGHVLGAAMFHIRVGKESVVYTGDFNMTPDRHLGAAWIDRCRPDVLITESTYGDSIRESKRSRERDFLQTVHGAIAGGGRVLIPCFALGRAQELCLLLDSYWEKTGLTAPIYFSSRMTKAATSYYKMFISWTNEKIKSSFVTRNMFDYKHVKPFEQRYHDIEGPMVLFSTPGMLHQGHSLSVFKRWAPDPKNMIIIPGYCVPGTVGARVIAGEKVIEIDKKNVHINLQIRFLSFSAHADTKGIIQLVKQCEPRNVMLVHGERKVMCNLAKTIEKEIGVPTFMPPNGETVTIRSREIIDVKISRTLYDQSLSMARLPNPESILTSVGERRKHLLAMLKPINSIHMDGYLVRNTTASGNATSDDNATSTGHTTYCLMDEQQFNSTQYQ